MSSGEPGGLSAVPLSRGQQLLEGAVRYALASTALVTPQLLSCPTPCTDWDLEMLLDHLSDSIGVLYEALATGGIVTRSTSLHPRLKPDPGARLRGEADRLLAACAAARPTRTPVAIGDRRLTASLVTATGAIEIAVHGWDIAIACGTRRPIPPLLAAVLLPIAPLLIPPGLRPGLFADPVQLASPASPSDQLVAFLGRQPGTGRSEEAESHRPARGDSWTYGWSI